MARPGLLDAEGSPERTCIVTRTKGMPEDMIRFVIGPGAIVVPDIATQIAGTWRLGNRADGSRRGSRQTASFFKGVQDEGRGSGKFAG